MKSLPRKHFLETARLIKKIDKIKIANWLLVEGYYPEQYVLPPCFKVNKLKYKLLPYYKIKRKGRKTEYKPNLSETLHISFPKSRLTDRIFGIIEPKIYHDIVYHLIEEWETVIEHLFKRNNYIYSYGFPIPVKKKNIGELGSLRAGRMIYEFIEMAENDLVAEAHKYKYIVHTDIKNFYPMIYTHSIAWALHTKAAARADRFNYTLLGNKLDKLLQCANDRCTNGIPIGSAISDLISEILLVTIDNNSSKQLNKEKIRFLGVRFKDDYRFLCNSKNDAERILRVLQANMKEYNLSLNEGKSKIKELPEGLYRPWIIDYNQHSLRYKRSVRYKKFESTLLTVLEIDQKYPDTGIIDKFLSELVTKRGRLKLSVKSNEVLKVFSLLFLLKERRSKTFPFILAIIELLLNKFEKKTKVIEHIKESMGIILSSYLKKNSDNIYDIIWLTYFIKAGRLISIKWPRKIDDLFLKSIKSNSQKFFNSRKDIILFAKIIKTKKSKRLVKYLAVFSSE